MLIVALVLAAVGLAALVTAVITSNEVLAFVCIAAAAIGVVLMIIDAVRDRHSGTLKDSSDDEADDRDDRHAEHDGDWAEADQADDQQESSSSAVDEQLSDDAAGTPARVDPKAAARAAHHHSPAEETYEQYDIDVDDDDDADH